MRSDSTFRVFAMALTLTTAFVTLGHAQYVPDLDALANSSQSALQAAVDRYAQDRQALFRRFDAEGSRQHRRTMRAFYTDWASALGAMDFDALGVEEAIDWVLLKNRIAYELRQLDRAEQIDADTASLLPFADTVLDLHEARRRLESVDPQTAAATLEDLVQAIEKTRKALERGLADGEKSDGDRIEASQTVAHRAAKRAESLRQTLADWFGHHNGYDPLFTWWAKDPHAKTDEALGDYVDFLRQKIVGEKEGEDPPIVGDPIGRDALSDDLALEMIAYTPEQLIAVADREFAWCEAEMLKASRQLGHGDDWKAALEHVKDLHMAPGKQPELVRDLAREAVDFLEERQLLTIPPLAKDVWRLEMMSPEMQKVAPFFLGGEVIMVSFPTDTMAHEQKRMSLRGNNIHFSRATVHHELIPGHHLQGFMTSRYNTHRRVFSTPFWTEGWALYWEMVLWDEGFPQTPENKIGMLFWRMHRCARIIFSLRFHLGEMTPQEAIDFLVDRVGHERDNATAEVRRSFEGSYSPLYQLAYMMGALQFRSLSEELVKSGGMPAREFHDAILRGGNMPVEMVRARLKGLKPGRAYRAAWKFAGEDPSAD